MKRILILTAGYGEGHNAAARALAEAVTAEGGEPMVRDLFLEAYGKTQETSVRLYATCINRAPWAWAMFYNFLDWLPVMRWLIEPSISAVRRLLEQIIRDWQPDAIVAVYPSYGYTLDRLYPRGGAPFGRYMLVTDSISVNSIWYRCGSDCWIVPNEATANVMRKKVPAEKLLPLGFPVPLAFEHGSAGPVARPAPGGAEPLRVLYMVNHAPEEAPALVRKLLDLPFVELTVAGGKDVNLLRRIERAATRPIELHGWTKRMPELLQRAHVLIGKAGGAATQESIAARTPMIITKVVPGQEEGNARLIEESGAGLICSTHAAILDQLTELHANHGALWQRWHENITKISRPDAGRQVARFVMRDAH